ncbi:MAG: hypothetical protein IJZ68_06760 [Bacteroidaceae bacterium]|nr:hypothetical protein [Bacteroidaceae bacterium]
MVRIINNQSTGKTRQLLTHAKENNCIVVCPIPNRMKDKAIRYGLGYIDCMSYEDFLNDYKAGTLPQGNYVVDELEKLVLLMFQNGAELNGYCLTTDV